MKAVIYEDTGEIVMGFAGNAESIALNALGRNYIMVSDEEELVGKFVSGGELVPLPDRPGRTHIFNYTTGVWEADFNNLKVVKWQEIKGIRDAKEFGSFMWNGVELDADEKSRARITGGTVGAMMDPNFTTSWTLADNSEALIDAPTMLSIGQALVDYTDGIHATGKSLRAQINAATTAAELAAITWG